MPFSIASFNAADLLDESSSPVTAETVFVLEDKLKAVARTLSRLDADIVCLQEIGSERILNRCLAKLGEGFRSYRHVLVGPGQDLRGIRLAILSRFPLIGKVYQHDIREDPEGFRLPSPSGGRNLDEMLQFRRGLLEAAFDVPGAGPVRVFCVHFKSNFPVLPSPPRTQADLAEGWVRAGLYRLAEALQTRRLVDVRLKEDPDQMLAVAGDFNETDRSLVHRVVMGDRPDGLLNRLETGALIPCSAAIAEERRWSNMYRGRKDLLDHILISESLSARFLDARIFNENYYAPPDVFGWQPAIGPDSDHAPMLATFR